MEPLTAFCVAWANSGRSLAVGSLRSTVLWSRTGALVIGKTFLAYGYALAFSPDDQSLACGSESRTAKLVTLLHNEYGTCTKACFRGSKSPASRVARCRSFRMARAA
jgi:hypothetical protein